jgi:MerR family copper efflux transcriptional regulator
MLTMQFRLQVNVDMKSTELTIGELARRFGLATHVLRHWESAGVLTPSRRVGGQRRYDEGHLATVAVILRAKEAGLSLGQLRELLAGGRLDRREVLQAQYDDLTRRIAEAKAAQVMLEHAMACRSEQLTACPEFRRLAAADIPAP